MMRILKSVFFAVVGFLVARRMARGPSTRELAPPEEPRAGRRSELKTFLKRLAMLVPVLAVLGFLIAASGIIPLKASSGHWAITAWFLNFSMERSVALHSTGITSPPLDDPVLVLKGAGHYDYGCRPCHGGPQGEHPRIPQQMTPNPPHLPPQIERFAPQELFYIVKHGEKFTGMPAWPAQSRDDEVWAVVAFLLRLPDMDMNEYTSLVEGPASRAGALGGPRQGADTTMAPGTTPSPGATTALDTSAVPGRSTAPGTAIAPDTKTDASAPMEGLIRPQGLPSGGDVPVTVTDRCGRCHGLQGEGREIGSFPRLSGQRPHYVFASLKAYADGERHSGIMQPIAAALTEEEMREIAFYYSRLNAPEISPAPDDEHRAAIDRGERIAREGIPSKRVPSCADCHGPGSLPRNPFYPHLAGQFAEYIKLQLELFKDDRRGGSVYAGLMHPTAEDLTEEQMRDVALYYASIAAESTDPASSPAEQP